MKKFLLSISFALLLSSISAYTCSSSTDPSDCAAMTGCTWDTVSNSCSGTFAPTCTPNCYYVDPQGGSDAQNGEAATPFKTLGPALTFLLGQTGTIIVINPSSSLEAKLLAPASVTSNVEIKPLFTTRMFVLSLTDFVVPSPVVPAFSITAGRLTMTNCLMNTQTAKLGLKTIFEIGNARLIFSNVYIYDYQGSIVLVNVISTATSAQFSFTLGKYVNTSFKFSMPNGVANTFALTSVDFLDVQGKDSIFYIGGVWTLNNIYVQNGAALLFNATTSTSFTATSVTFNGYNGNFFYGNAPSLFKISSSQFLNIYQTLGLPFIYLKSKPGTTTVSHSISDCDFTDVKVRISLILIETNAFTLQLNNVNMKNIAKINVPPQEKTMDELTLESQFSGGICALARDSTFLSLSSSNFTNIYSHCIGVSQAALTISLSIFNNTNIDPSYKTSFTSTTSFGSLDETDGVSFVIYQDATSEISPQTKVGVTSSQFIENNIYSKYGGAIRILGVFANVALQTTSTTFIGLKALHGGAVYIENPLAVFESSGDTFQNNIALNGGAIYKTSIEIDTILGPVNAIKDLTKFSNNKALNKGGALFLDYQKIKVENTEFSNNEAQFGGAIYFLKQNPFATSPNLFSTTIFQHNYATISGGAFKILFNSSDLGDPTGSGTTFENNTDIKGLSNIVDGKPSYYRFSFYDVTSEGEKEIIETNYLNWISDPTLTKLSSTFIANDFPSDFLLKHKSGHDLNQIISVEIYDDKDQLADYIHNEAISATISDVQNDVSDFMSFLASSPVTFNFYYGRIAMKASMIMVGEPQTQATLTISGVESLSNILLDANVLLTQNLQVFFDDCEIGDVFDPLTRICDTCAQGFYSLISPYLSSSCLMCDSQKAVCLGGSQVAPKAGYWRYDINSDNFLECPQSSACLGGWINETYFPHGECEFPYEGNLCNQCAPNYAKFGSGSSCVSCATDKMYYVKFVGFFLIQVIVLLYGIKCNMNKTNLVEGDTEEAKQRKEALRTDSFQSNLMKITINFLQISGIVIQYNFDWPPFVTKVVNATNKIIPSDKEGFSVDCIVAMITGNNQYINFIKLVITLIQPFVMLAGLFLVYLLYLKLTKEKIKGNPKVQKNVLVLFIITAFLLQPNIIQATLEMFRCVNYGSDSNPVYFMKQDSEVQCWTYTHIFWSVIIALPNFCLWTLILPLSLLRVLRKNAKNLDNLELYAKYSFVYDGLRKDKYYWEFIILTRKTLIVIIFVFLNFVSSQSQAFATFLIILLFCSLHYVMWPYDDERLNRAELLSLVTSGIMVYCGMFFLADGGNDWLNTILIIFSAACNLIFYLYIAKNFVVALRKKALQFTRQAKNLKKKLKNMKDEYVEKRRSNKSGSNSSNYTSSVEEKKNASGIEMKDLSSVLNQIQGDTPGLPLSPLERLLNLGNENDDQDHSSIPTENEEHVGRSKTVYNEEKVNISNHSVFRKSFVLPRQEQKESYSRGDSGLTLMTPEMLNDMLNIFKTRKSSPTQDNNSNDSPFLGRTFTLHEKVYEPQNNVSKDAEEDED